MSSIPFTKMVDAIRYSGNCVVDDSTGQLTPIQWVAEFALLTPDNNVSGETQPVMVCEGITFSANVITLDLNGRPHLSKVSLGVVENMEGLPVAKALENFNIKHSPLHGSKEPVLCEITGLVQLFVPAPTAPPPAPDETAEQSVQEQ